MTIEEIIRQKMLADPVISDYVGGERFFPAPAQHPPTVPYITYQLISSPEEGDIEGRSTLGTNRIQLSAISLDWLEARAIIEECRRVALDPAQRGQADDLVIDSIFIADKRDMGIDEDTGYFRHDLDIEVWQQLGGN